jgi:hypothetical protein
MGADAVTLESPTARRPAEAATLWQWWRDRRARIRARYAYRGPGANDADHIGTFGGVWFVHAYSVEAAIRNNRPRWRATCKCGHRGAWWPWKITAEIDAEFHPMQADWMWD